MTLYVNYTGNLPRQLFTDALMVAIYGPSVKLCAIETYRIVDGRFVFTRPPGMPDDVQIGMLPAWWD